MKIPTPSQCYRLIEAMGMLAHIVTHSEQVCRVALCLSAHLSARGVSLNHALIRASAMLHDITKTRSFETKENHAETGAEYLAGLGYPEVGLIVGQHVRLDSYFAFPVPCEAEIVNYADKRVLHDEIAPLETRMQYILEKYGESPPRRQQILHLWRKSAELEDRIFKYLPFPPDDLERRIEAHELSALF